MSTSPSREQVCEQTARKLADAASALAGLKALVGLDGFVDEIIAVVDKRHDFERFEAITTIDGFGRKITLAAGQSSNYELVVKQMKLGGNGPIMANALASAGAGVTYVGTVGYPSIHPVFQDMTRHAKVISIGEPGHTDALEFDDGKLMLGKITPMNDVTWDNLLARVGGEEKFRSLLNESRLIAFVNWTMLPYMSDIWRKMLERRIPSRSAQNPLFFVDLADPEKRRPDDILQALNLLTRFQEQVDVALGLNLKESSEIAEVLGLHVGGEPELAIEATARSIRRKLGVSCVVIHPRRAAAAATADESATFLGPFVQQPKISTGAGDHFNAGFCLGRVLGFSLEESLCTGVATSGYYVRTAQSPGANQLAEFVRTLPPPQ